MFLPPGKAMRLRRDIAFAVICLRRDICPSDKLWIKNFHSVQRTLSFRAEIRGPRGILCTRGEKAHNVKKQIKTDAGLRPSCAT